MGLTRRPTVLGWAAVLALGLWGGYAQSLATAAIDEESIKAAYLFNFLQFVEWPEGSGKAGSDKVMIGVLAYDPYADVLERDLAGKTIGEKTVWVQRVTRAQEAVQCHALFLGDVGDMDAGRMLYLLRNTDVLTVGDIPRFAQRGGMIGFREEANRIGFDINLRTTARAKLKISSKLLSLARVVIGGPPVE